MLKLIYTNEADIPAELKNFYKQVGTEWHLQVEGGAVARGKLDEFRDANVKSRERIEALEAEAKKFEGIDPERARTLLARASDIENGELIKKGEVDKAKQQIKESLTAEHEGQVRELKRSLTERENELAATKTALATAVIDNQLLAEARKLGLQPGAEKFLVNTARQTWKLENGVPVAYGEDGKKEYGRTGDPISMSEWLERLGQTASFMFKPNQGSGAQPSADNIGNTTSATGGTRAPHTGTNPWKKGTVNLTEQMRIINANPQEAVRLAGEAGVKLDLAKLKVGA